MVIGCSGSGKSTFSQALSEATGLPLITLDQYYWKPNWVESELIEWKNKTAELVNQDRWIMDGNYGTTMDMRI